jgi:hypothetical protein
LGCIGLNRFFESSVQSGGALTGTIDEQQYKHRDLLKTIRTEKI